MTITQTLTLAQLRDDITALASAHPGCYPTNVIEVIHQCGEITVEPENEEDALREELKAQEAATEEAEKDAMLTMERAEAMEAECEALRAEMRQLRDPSEEGETVLSYRERAKAAEEQARKSLDQMIIMRGFMEHTERECKALRARKGVTAGLFKNVHEVLQILYVIAENKGITGERAAEILSRIKNT